MSMGRGQGDGDLDIGSTPLANQPTGASAFEIGPVAAGECWYHHSGERWTPEDIADDDLCIYLNVRRNGQVVGSFSYCNSVEDALWRDDSLEKRYLRGPFFKADSDPLYLDNMFVLPEERGTGIFQAMVAYLRDLDRGVVAWFTNPQLLDHFARNYRAAQ